MAGWLFLTAWTLIATPVGHANPSTSAMMFSSKGMSRLALRAVRQEQESRPDDPDLHAQTGAILMALGAWSDAVVAFDLSTGGGRFYNQIGGLRKHADALREVGRPIEAAALRREALASTGSKGRLALYQGLIRDHIIAGNLAQSRAVGIEAIAEFPNAANLYAQLAEVEVEAGDRDAAESLLWLSELLQPAGVFRLHLLRARLALADGMYDDARKHLSVLRKRDLRNVEVLQALFQLEVASNGAASALVLLEQPIWEQQMHPGVACAAALAHFDLGERAEARAAVQDLLRAYPERKDVQALDYIVRSW